MGGADVLMLLQLPDIIQFRMRHLLALIALTSLSACGSGSKTFDDIASARWANSTESCDRHFTTFDDRMIRWHYPDGTLDFGKIVMISEASPSRVMLTVEPSSAIRSAAAVKRPELRLPRAVTMGFEMKGEHLHLPAMVGGDHGEVGGALDHRSIEYRLFDFVRCKG